MCVFIPAFLTSVSVCLPEQSIKMFIRGRPITMYIPSNIQNYEDLKMETPSEKLELDWVYPSRKFSFSCAFVRPVLYSPTSLRSHLQSLGSTVCPHLCEMRQPLDYRHTEAVYKA